MLKRYEVVAVAEYDSEYGRCGTCKHYQHLITCGECSNGSRYCFAWREYYESNKKKFENEFNKEVINMHYRDYEITNKWWKKQLSITYNGKEVLFDSLEELKCFVDELYLM